MQREAAVSEVKRVAVTGARGFIGNVLCAALAARGVSILALLREAQDGPWDEALLHKLGSGPIHHDFSGIDVVYHLAGYAHATDDSGGEESAYERTNVRGTQEVMQAAIAGGVRRVIVFSSVKAMGEGAPVCLDECAPCRPVTAYGRSKRAAELAALEMAAGTVTDVVVLRLPLVHGTGQKGNLTRMFKALAARRLPPLAAAGNRRSMVHVDDVTDAALRVGGCACAGGEIYIVAPSQAYSTAEIDAIMRDALGRARARWRLPVAWLKPAALIGDVIGRLWGRSPFDSQALARLTESAWYSGAKLAEHTGWQARRSLRDTFTDIVRQEQMCATSGSRTAGS